MCTPAAAAAVTAAAAAAEYQKRRRRSVKNGFYWRHEINMLFDIWSYCVAIWNSHIPSCYVLFKQQQQNIIYNMVIFFSVTPLTPDYSHKHKHIHSLNLYLNNLEKFVVVAVVVLVVFFLFFLFFCVVFVLQFLSNF